MKKKLFIIASLIIAFIIIFFVVKSIKNNYVRKQYVNVIDYFNIEANSSENQNVIQENGIDYENVNTYNENETNSQNQTNILNDNTTSNSTQSDDTTSENSNEFSKIKSKYNGNYDIDSIENNLTYFARDVRVIYSNSKSKSHNKILQYYDLNKESINNYSIYDRTSYLNIAIQILSMKWTQNPVYRSYKIDADSFESDNAFSYVKATLYYSTGDTIKLIIEIPNDTSKNANVMFSSEDKTQLSE